MDWLLIAGWSLKTNTSSAPLLSDLKILFSIQCIVYSIRIWMKRGCVKSSEHSKGVEKMKRAFHVCVPSVDVFSYSPHILVKQSRIWSMNGKWWGLTAQCYFNAPDILEKVFYWWRIYSVFILLAYSTQCNASTRRCTFYTQFYWGLNY